MGLIWGEQLSWPPSGNQLIRTSWQARRHYPSDQYVEWDRINLATILAMPTLPVIDYPVRLRLVFRPPNRMRYDLDNRTKAVQDLLVKAGVIQDDHARIISHVHLEGLPSIKGEAGHVIVAICTI